MPAPCPHPTLFSHLTCPFHIRPASDCVRPASQLLRLPPGMQARGCCAGPARRPGALCAVFHDLPPSGALQQGTTLRSALVQRHRQCRARQLALARPLWAKSGVPIRSGCAIGTSVPYSLAPTPSQCLHPTPVLSASHSLCEQVMLEFENALLSVVPELKAMPYW